MLKNELFYSYIDECDKEAIAIESAFDIEMAKLDLAYEYADRLFDIKLMEADARVLNESGTYEDIDKLYAEAGAEAGAQKEGIIKKIIRTISEFIGNIFNAIGNFFNNKKNQQVLDEAEKSGKFKNIKLPNINVCMDKIQKAINTVDKYVKPAYTVTDENGEQVFDAVQTALSAIKAAGITHGSIEAGKKIIETIKGFVDWAKKKITSLESGEVKGSGAKKALEGLQLIMKQLNSAWTFVSNKFMDIISKFTKKSDDVAEEVPAEEETPAEPAEKTEESADDFIADQELMETCSDILELIDSL